MKFGSLISIIGFICIIMGLVPYGVSPNLFLLLTGILCIITGVFRNKGYFNKNYFMAIFSVIALWGLMLLYIFLFRTNEYLESTNIFYFQMVLFILLVIFFGRAYILRLKKGNL